MNTEIANAVNAAGDKAQYDTHVKRLLAQKSILAHCFIWIPIVLCVVIGVLTYFYKLDSIRTTMTDELDNRRKNLNLMESGCGEIA